jgi:hypothetical protein
VSELIINDIFINIRISIKTVCSHYMISSWQYVNWVFSLGFPPHHYFEIAPSRPPYVDTSLLVSRYVFACLSPDSVTDVNMDFRNTRYECHAIAVHLTFRGLLFNSFPVSVWCIIQYWTSKFSAIHTYTYTHTHTEERVVFSLDLHVHKTGRNNTVTTKSSLLADGSNGRIIVAQYVDHYIGV